MTFLAAREAAHHRLFSHVPWLASQLLNAVEAFAKGMKIDMSGIEEFAAGFNPASLTDPSQMEQLLNQGIFEPKATPEQTAALERLETLLALIEGWVQTVVNDALGERIPGASALSETLRRRRATGGPAEQTFATLVGLELRPRKLREAAVLWEKLTQAAGVDARDAVWQHPDLLPSSDDLDEPAGFIDRVIGGDTSGFDSAIEEAIDRRPRQGRRDGPGRQDGLTAARGLWITRGRRARCVAESVHDALCAQPGHAGVVPSRRGGAGGLGSAARGAGSSAVRDDHRGARPTCCGSCNPARRSPSVQALGRRRRRDRDRRSGCRAGRRGGGDRDAAPAHPLGVDPHPRPRTAVGPAGQCAALLGRPDQAQQPAPRRRHGRDHRPGRAVGFTCGRSADAARAARRADAAPAGAGSRRRRSGRAAGGARRDQLSGLRGSASQRPGRELARRRRSAARHRRQRRPGDRAGHRGAGAQPGRPRHRGRARRRRTRSRTASAVDARHHAGVRRQHRLDRGPPVVAASAECTQCSGVRHG